MADLLTHLFVPLTAVYVLRRDRFESPWVFAIAGFALLADFDKVLGRPGLLHSLLTLVPIAVAIVAVERWRRGELWLAPAIVALVFSHLVHDVADGGPVPLLYPLIRDGIGLTYPARIAFGAGPLGVAIEGPLVAGRVAEPRPGFNSYGFITGSGVVSLLLFVVVYAGLRGRDGLRRGAV